MTKIIQLLSVLIFLFNLFPQSLYASENQFVTIVNPVRIAPYTRDVSASIASEYSVLRERNLPATWLLTYDVLSNEKAVDTIKRMDDKQETGIFLEVSPLLCEKAQVTCNQGSWHHANVIFLSGYKQEDRKKLIDTVFSLYKEKFGLYPTSVGSWWTDSFSLSYIKDTYGITANLTCSDQFSTDGYQIWGQYWMHPFMPSKFHAGMPAISRENQLDIVTIQWAPRDPLNGYESSLYSTQDYQTRPLNYDTRYFEKLIKTYGFANKNSFGQITVGLEGDYNPNDYKGEYINQMNIVNKFVDNGEINAITMSQFANWHKNNFNDTQVSFTQSDDFSDTKKAYWYSSKNMRVGIMHNTENQTTDIIDFRSYHNNFQEPYYIARNNEHELSINIPSYVDTGSTKNDIWNIPTGKLQQVSYVDNEAILQFENEKIVIKPNELIIEQYDIVVPNIILKAKTLTSNKSQNSISVQPVEEWIVPQAGVLVNALSENGFNELNRKRTKAILLFGFSLWMITSIIIFKRSKTGSQKIFLISVISSLFLLLCFIWYQRNLVTYFVSQAEVDALQRLSTMPHGKVLVYDHECIGCDWSTPYKPAAYANQKRYVKNLSGKSILYNASVFEAKTQEEAKKEFQDLHVRYIYLVKYEGMREKTPFSPGDLNIEKVYANANAEIWKVK